MKKWKEISRKTKTIIFSALAATGLLATASATTAYAVITSNSTSKQKSTPTIYKGFGEYEDNIFEVFKSSACIPADYRDLHYDKYEHIDEMSISDAFNFDKDVPVSVNVKAQHRLSIFVEVILAALGLGSNLFSKNNVFKWNMNHNVGSSNNEKETDNLIAPMLLYHGFDNERLFENANVFATLKEKTKINNSLKERTINLFDYSRLSIFRKSQDFIKMLLDLSTNLVLKIYEIINSQISHYDSTLFATFNAYNLSINSNNSKNDSDQKEESINEQIKDLLDKNQQNGDKYQQYLDFKKNNPEEAKKIKIPEYSSSGNFSINIKYYKNQRDDFRKINNQINLGFSNAAPSLLNPQMNNTLLNRTKLASFGYQFLSNTAYDWLLTKLHKLFLKNSSIGKKEIEPTLDSILVFLVKAILGTLFPQPMGTILFGNSLENIKAAILSGLMFLFRLYSVINYVATAIDYYVRYYTNTEKTAPSVILLTLASFVKRCAIKEIDWIISGFYGSKWVDFDSVTEYSEEDKKDKNKKTIISKSNASALNFIIANLVSVIKGIIIPFFEGGDILNDEPGLMEFIILGFSYVNNFLVNMLRIPMMTFFAISYLSLLKMLNSLNPISKEVIFTTFIACFVTFKTSLIILNITKYFQQNNWTSIIKDNVSNFFESLLTLRTLFVLADALDYCTNLLQNILSVASTQTNVGFIQKIVDAIATISSWTNEVMHLVIKWVMLFKS